MENLNNSALDCVPANVCCFYIHQGSNFNTDNKFWGYKIYTPEKILALMLKVIQENSWRLPIHYTD